MRFLTAAVLLAAASTPSVACADTYPLDKVIIAGNAQVPSDTLKAVVQEKAGQKVTKDAILADQDAIVAVYKKANVGMSIKVLLATKSNGHVEVTFKIDEQAAPPPEKVVTDLHLAHVTFVGNKVVSTEKLMAADGEKPGEVVTSDTVKAAQARIAAAYKDVKEPVAVEVDMSATYPSPGQVDILWTLKESKPKPKKNTDDSGYAQ
jgi:outer membrane protein assembly factor BamA